MKHVGLYEAKTSLSALVAEVEATGNPVALTKHGRVVAELGPPTVSAPKAGMLATDGFFMAEDFDAEGVGFEDLLADEGDLPPQLRRIAEEPPPYGAP